jgi:molecular chaperone HtpG
VETLEFQAEARQLLQLMIHSVYSSTDLFLRELISNASDALDKLRLETYRDKDLVADVSDLQVEIRPDPVGRTLTVRDNGIGMSRDEVVAVIGTIARSGTSEFARRFDQTGDPSAAAELIGRFGIGFYASFMVADEVTLVTRRAGSAEGTRWRSTGEGTYTIETLPDAPVGTSVTVLLKPPGDLDDPRDYTDPDTIRDVVRRHSDFVSWPIRLRTAARDDEPLTAPDGEDADDARPPAGDSGPDGEDTQGAQPPAGDSGPDREDARPGGDGGPDGEDAGTGQARTASDATEGGGAPDGEILNSRTPLWRRERATITEDEYADLYRRVSGNPWGRPLLTVPLSLEGRLEFRAILFVPPAAPYDPYGAAEHRGPQLYVRNVLVAEDFPDLLPAFLRFVRGVVDAPDLPLTVSRESLQSDARIEVMRRQLTRKVLAALDDLATSAPDRYATCWDQFGAVLKEGIVREAASRQTLLKLARFASTAGDEPVRLAEYVERMPEGQAHIYYLAGAPVEVLRESPHLESFTATGREVLLLGDPVDALWVEVDPTFADLPFRSASSAVTDSAVTDEDADTADGPAGEPDAATDDAGIQRLDPLVTWMSGVLATRVGGVRISSALTSSPARIVVEDGDFGAGMDAAYRYALKSMTHTSRILEVNPSHPLVDRLAADLAELHPPTAPAEPGAGPADDDPEDDPGDDPGLADLRETVDLLYGMAVLADGKPLDNPGRFVRTVAARLAGDRAVSPAAAEGA